MFGPMSENLVWISGASGGIGGALAETVPWDGSRVINIARRPAPGTEHVEADLADPASWRVVGESFRREADKAGGEGRIVFVHAAGTIEPMGYAGEVDTDTYLANVVLNSAVPQALGHMFLAAVRDRGGPRHLVMITSGAARSVYPGWSSYGAGKAAVDQWVRDVGAEQAERGGTRVISVAPGTVDTGMQRQLREVDATHFPQRQKFVDIHRDGKLTAPTAVARDIWGLLDRELANGSVVDLRDLAKT